MFTRYEQDLTPFFERIREQKQARGAERRRWWRDGWANLLSHVRPASRRS